jgi:hypothetical protein
MVIYHVCALDEKQLHFLEPDESVLRFHKDPRLLHA